MSSPSEDHRSTYARFALEFIAPMAFRADRTGVLDSSVIDALRQQGFLGAFVPMEYGGLGMDQVNYGVLTGEIGRACSAARTLLTVHGLVQTALLRWGSAVTRTEWLPDLASGRKIAAFALSESDAGSDISNLATEIRLESDEIVVSGQKMWVSFGQTADVFLVFGRSAEGASAILVPGTCRNLVRQAVPTMVGTRGAAMAHLYLDKCRVPRHALIGRSGFGLSHVAAAALDFGRYSVAWGAVGIIDAALSASWQFTGQRMQNAIPLRDQPLMRARLARLEVTARAARALCIEAGQLRDSRKPSAVSHTIAAKYFASKAAVRAANEAIQIHGARGLLEETGIERLLRDARVTEIIEGSSDTIELLLGQSDFRSFD